MLRGLLMALAMMAIAGPLAGQEARFRKLTIDDGLSQNAVYALLQDRRGFMWFGTKDGLNRYDGYGFTVFRHDPFDPESLPDNDITKLFEDTHGGLWIGTRSGSLCYYRPDRETFIRVDLTPDRGTPAATAEISALTGSQGNTLWVAALGRGLYRLTYDPDSLPACRMAFHARDPKDPHSLPGDKVGALLLDQRGRLWVGSDQGLSVLEPPETQFRHTVFPVKARDAPPTGTDQQVNAIHEDRNGALWLGTPSGLIRYDRSTGDYVHYPHRYAVFRYGWGVILRIAEDDQGLLWLATHTGLMRFDPRTARYTYYQHDPEDPHSLNFDLVSSLWVDRTGIVWAGTAGQGINRYDPKAGRFHTLLRKQDAKSRIAGFSVRALLEDDSGKLWISAGVLYRWDRRTGVLRSFETHSNFPNDFGNTEVSSLCQDARGRIWAAGTRGLFRFDPATERSRQFTPAPDSPRGLPEWELKAVLEDHTGNLWVAGRYTLSRMTDEDAGAFEVIAYQTEQEGDRNHHVSMIQVQDGALWLGATTGLFRFDPRTGTLRTIRHDASDPKSLSSNHIKCLAIDPHQPDRFLWIGTVNGLNRLDLGTMTFRHFRERDGLPNEVVYAILPDGQGHLWISTNKGLSRFDPAGEIFRNFDVHDGLQSNEFNTGAYFRSPRGELFFGGIQGLNYFFPEQVQDNPFPPPLAITRFTILQKSVGLRTVYTLRHSDNIFAFEFSALDFSAPEKNRYAYKLEGFHADWIPAGTGRTATFTNLAPGRYVFRVKGSNNDGVWNEEGLAVTLRVLPPWWRTWWAYAAYSVLFLLGLLGVRRYELHRFRLRNQLRLERVQTESLRNLDELKSRFFANISHEFRTPLTLIQGQLEAVSAGEKDPGRQAKLQSASHHAHRLLELINQLLDLSRMDAGRLVLEPSRCELVAFLRGLLGSFETRAESLGIALRFQADPDEIPARVDMDKLEKVFNNLIANALKFSDPGGEVTISLGLRDAQTAIIRIKDRGCGISAEQLPHIFERFYQADGSHTRKHPGTGIGLSIVREYIRLHGGSVSVSSQTSRVAREGSSGTEFTIVLPLGLERGATPPEEADTRARPLADPEEEDAGLDPKALVLIVEDQPEVQAFLREQLEGDYRILTARDGREGIACALQEIPDLIITDWMMPEMDGHAFAQRMKSEARTCHIPIIMLTAKTGLEDKITGLETGIEAYLTKPFSVRELQVRVQTLIRERKKLQRRFASATLIKPSEVSVIPADRLFLEKALQVTEAHLDEEGFRVEALAEAMHMSSSQLNRKLNALLGQSGGRFIQSIRLQRASDLLRQQAGTVAEIAYQVGFTDQAYFARVFRKQFGLSPSAYAASGS